MGDQIRANNMISAAEFFGDPADGQLFLKIKFGERFPLQLNPPLLHHGEKLAGDGSRARRDLMLPEKLFDSRRPDSELLPDLGERPSAVRLVKVPHRLNVTGIPPNVFSLARHKKVFQL